MKLFTDRRPSAGTLVAVIALTFALAGTAIAAEPAERALTKAKVKKIARKQADKRLRANVLGSHVNLADKATTATSATSATNATNAVNATNATNATNSNNGASGFARVLPDGTLRAGSFGLDALDNPFPGVGIYCEDTAYETATLTEGLTATGNVAFGAHAFDADQVADFGANLTALGCAASDEWAYWLDVFGSFEDSYFTVVNHG